MCSVPEKVPRVWKHPFAEDQASDPGDQASDRADQASDENHQASDKVTAENGQKLKFEI